MTTVSDYYKLECENQRLKEELEVIRNVGAFYLRRTSNLKQKLEKAEEYIDSKMYSNDEKFNNFITKLKGLMK